MTIFAGILSRKGGRRIDERLCESLRALVSRHPGDEVATFKAGRCFFAKVDIGAFGSPAFHVDPSGAASMLAGEPLFAVGSEETYRTRQDDLERLHRGLDSETWNLLKTARGTYCAAYYNPGTETLALITDKLGVRSLYFYESDEYVCFATALRILEELPEIPKRLDVSAVAEMATLHAPLSDRTPYVGVSLLKAGEIIRIRGREASRSRYWRWDDVPQTDPPLADLLSLAYTRFRTAVKVRLRGDARALALLSGGLDSRCVIAALRAAEVRVHSFNFSPPGTQDRFFAQEFARQAGTQHQEIPIDPRMSEPLGLYQIVADAVRATATALEDPVERPKIAWGGNGGSVCLGHVYLSPELADLVRSGRRSDAIELYLGHAALAKRIIRGSIYPSLHASIRKGIVEELEDARCGDPGRGFHLFLLHNDQRRHLCDWYEHIDLHRLELQLPFYDGEFLELIASTPLDAYLGHRFYTQWLRCFPASVTGVPWQTYPGHEPCPVTFEDSGLGYQFGGAFSREWTEIQKQGRLRHAREMLGARGFPDPILNRMVLQLSTWAYARGFRDYSYVIDTAYCFYRYWRRCGGKYVLPSASHSASLGA
jgi:asparagine synthase (glutamine-hydrolysing)